MPKRKARWNKAGLVNDLRMYDLLKISSTGGELVKKTVGTHSLDSDGYSVSWGLTHYLSTKQPKQFQSFLREAAAIEPLADLRADRAAIDRELFVKHFGGDFAGSRRTWPNT